ncbi:MAG TPA: M1 family metallopeptidase [Gemmatimonadales bacterium]
MRSGSRSAGALWALVAVLAAGAPSAAAQRPGIDVFLYHFDIDLPDTGAAFSAVANVAFTRTPAAGDALTLDLVGLHVDSVDNSTTADSLARRFTYDGKSLRVPLGAVTGRAIGRVTVYYHGVPGDGLAIATDSSGRRSAFADDWPERARYWLPLVDAPADKAAVEFTVDAPARWRVVANGRLLDTLDLGAGRTRWIWRETHPIPTYTMVIAAGPLVESEHRPAESNGVRTPVRVWTFPEDSAFADSVPFRSVTDVVETLERVVGPFPYEKLAHVESSTRFGGMENATAIFYARRPYVTRRMGESVVRHETAHQWFGDAVTARDFHHLWLSEGFASYFDLVVGAALHGDSVLAQGMRADAEAYRKSAVVGRPIIDTAEHDVGKLLNENNYQKGAWVLHMLRHQLGDSTFFRGVRDYYAAYRDSSVSSEQFQAVMERRARKKLDWFFAQWLGQPGYPQLDVSWKPNAFNQRVTITVTQTQPAAWGVFRLPDVPVELRDAAGHTARRSLSVDGPSTLARIDAPFTPTELVVDPDGTLLLTATVHSER